MHKVYVVRFKKQLEKFGVVSSAWCIPDDNSTEMKCFVPQYYNVKHRIKEAVESHCPVDIQSWIQHSVILMKEERTFEDGWNRRSAYVLHPGFSSGPEKGRSKRTKLPNVRLREIHSIKRKRDGKESYPRDDISSDTEEDEEDQSRSGRKPAKRTKKKGSSVKPSSSMPTVKFTNSSSIEDRQSSSSESESDANVTPIRGAKAPQSTSRKELHFTSGSQENRPSDLRIHQDRLAVTPEKQSNHKGSSTPGDQSLLPILSPESLQLLAAVNKSTPPLSSHVNHQRPSINSKGCNSNSLKSTNTLTPSSTPTVVQVEAGNSMSKQQQGTAKEKHRPQPPINNDTTISVTASKSTPGVAMSKTLLEGDNDDPVLMALSYLVVAVDDMKKDIALLMTTKANETLRTTITKKRHKIPVNTKEQLESIERLLKDEVESDTVARPDFDALVAQLGCKGGKSVQLVTDRVMAALMTYSLGLCYNFEGRKREKKGVQPSAVEEIEKEAFSHFPLIIDAICLAAQLNPQASKSKNDDVEACIKIWLKKAKSNDSKSSK